MEREQITIRLSAELLKTLRQEADRRGYPTKDLIMFILNDWLNSQNSPLAFK